MQYVPVEGIHYIVQKVERGLHGSSGTNASGIQI